MSQRSHSTGLVQDCLEILAPDEILKVVFIFIQILKVFFLLLSFFRIYTSVGLVTTTISLSASKLTSTSKQNQVGGAGHKVMLLMEGKAHAYVIPSPGGENILDSVHRCLEL